MITAVILTRDEEKNIEECLRVLYWCDELIVIDDNSSDKTVEIARKMGAKVFSHALKDDFSQQRNYGLEKTKSDWVLFVDADERVSEALASELSTFPSARAQGEGNSQLSTQYVGFYIKRKDFMWGKELKHGETGKVKLLRLAKKAAGEWEGKVHEEWKIKGKIGQLNSPLLHYPHQSITEFLKEINFYTDIRAKELYERGVRVNFFSIIAYPKAKFLFNYFLKLGFLDGVNGFIFALMMSFHSFLVRGKLWLLWKRK